jgi:hypothetical protein
MAIQLHAVLGIASIVHYADQTLTLRQRTGVHFSLVNDATTLRGLLGAGSTRSSSHATNNTSFRFAIFAVRSSAHATVEVAAIYTSSVVHTQEGIH